MKLCFPESILKQHLVVLGKTGAGKSSALRHIVEHLLDQNKRVCIIDPKGDWSGLKSSADGKGPGYPVIGFGDFKNPKGSDIPINQQSGKHVAELIASGNRPCIIGFRGWMTGHMIRFWIDFASTLFNANPGELYLVGDEFHNFAPKGKIMDPESGKCLHWSNRLMSEGRGYGLVCLIASQRPQKVHNDTLTCCETLVAMRVIHKADRDAVQDWIEGCGDMAKGKEVLNALAGMPRGEAYVWSPEIDYGPKRIAFPMFETFDSFAPPQLQKIVSEGGWSEVDLNEVKEKLAVVIEEAQANDPAHLKQTIRELRQLLKDGAAKDNGVVREVAMVTNEDVAMVDKAAQLFERVHASNQEATRAAQEVYKELNSISARLSVELRKLHQSTPTPPMPRLPVDVPPRTASSENNGSLGRCERSILQVLSRYPHGRTAEQLGILSGYSVNSGGFNNALGKLRSGGLITRGAPIQITKDGQGLLGECEPLPTGDALRAYWLSKLPKCERAILSALCQEYPRGVDALELGVMTNYSPNSGGFNNALGRLRTLVLITRGQPIRARDELFE